MQHHKIKAQKFCKLSGAKSDSLTYNFVIQRIQKEVEEVTSKFALIIANTEYGDPGLAQLTAPGIDAKEFGRALDSPEIGAFDDVIILFNENSSKVSEVIDHFFSAKKPDDLLLLYFSGHGVRDEYGSLYLAVKNTNRERLRSTAIKSDFIRDAMDQSRSRRQVLILDCCNSGAFAQGTKAETGGSIGTAKAFEGRGYGRIVLAASDSTQFAWEGDKVIGSDTSNSLFTHFLVKGLEGEADRDGDGKITVDELYDYAYERIVDQTSKQTPGKWSYKQQGDIVLRENLKPRDVKPAPLPSGVLDLLSHPNPGVRGMGIQDLIKLLSGQHLGLARGAEEKLREIAINDDSQTLRKTASDTLIAHGISVEPTSEISKESSAVAQPAPVEIPKQEREEKKIENVPALPAREPPSRVPMAGFREETRNEVEKPISIRGAVTTDKLARTNRNSRLIGGIVGLLVSVLCLWGASNLLSNMLIAAPESTSTSQPSTTITSQPEQTNSPSPTETSIPPTAVLGIGSTIISEKDGMTLVYVPAGEFTMGSDEGEDNEKPAHTVDLDAFWIDQTEVTNAMYAKCVQDRDCNEPVPADSYTRDSYYGNSDFDNYPVIYVSWFAAQDYCSWADRRLPTEAEWEKAARGTDAFIYPWGNDSPSDSLLNYNSAVGDTTEVGKYPNGIGPYGALDMAGNVLEWASSLYQPYPYSSTDGREDSSATGERVIRGGSWYCTPDCVRSAYREIAGPSASYVHLGFRCAMDATP